MTQPAPVVFLLDVDNALLDNDRIMADLKRKLTQAFGAQCQERYWTIFEERRAELGYTDYLGALQRYQFQPQASRRGGHAQHGLSGARGASFYPFFLQGFKGRCQVVHCDAPFQIESQFITRHVGPVQGDRIPGRGGDRELRGFLREFARRDERYRFAPGGRAGAIEGQNPVVERGVLRRRSVGINIHVCAEHKVFHVFPELGVRGALDREATFIGGIVAPGELYRGRI